MIKQNKSPNQQMLPFLIISATLSIVGTTLYLIFKSKPREEICGSFSQCASTQIDRTLHSLIVGVILVPVFCTASLLIGMYVVPYLGKLKSTLDEKYGTDVEE
jgi:NADH:ubiquinone oxidoreductase subunit 5 (subunit L)/multisubunit Na+/H+ antiporter MnhA subunit